MGNNVFQTVSITIIIISFTAISSLQVNKDTHQQWAQYPSILVESLDTENVKNKEDEIDLNKLKETKQLISNVVEDKIADMYRLEIYRLENVLKEKELKTAEMKDVRIKPMLRHIPFAYYNMSRILDPFGVDALECIPNSSEDFPKDLFTMEQKKNGAVFLHFVLGVYCFTLLAVVCNDYFLPAVERICEAMSLSEDVAAATFMAIATSAPEFFVNCVGTFVTESDIGVGTVVGSAIFNTLGVAGLGGLAASKPIQLHWWPLTRDSIIYVLVVSMLVLMCRDEKVQWYEAAILLIFYIIYFVVMWRNGYIKKQAKKVVRSVRGSKGTIHANDQSSTSTLDSVSTNPSVISGTQIQDDQIDIIMPSIETTVDEMSHNQLWSIPKGSCSYKIWFIYSWPIRFLLTYTIPDCKRYPKLFPITFFMCVVWIGSNSYMVSWMITVIGNTLGVADFVMGLTFLAAGGCLPEAISIVIVCRKGKGGMGVSNSLGANTLDILLCLGLPWFIKTMITNRSPIILGSGSLFYTIIALILAVIALYTTICLAGYKLNRKIGFILIIIYIGFLTSAIVLEMLFMDNGYLKPCAFA